MNVHGALNDGVGRLRIHDVEQNVNYFIATNSKDRSSQNLFRFRIDADFHKALGLAFFVGPAHTAHGIFHSERVTSGLPYLCIRHAASTQGWIDIESVGLDPVRDPA